MGFWDGCEAIERIPGKVSGKWVFRGTRMPVAALFGVFQTGTILTISTSGFPEWTKNL